MSDTFDVAASHSATAEFQKQLQEKNHLSATVKDWYYFPSGFNGATTTLKSRP